MILASLESFLGSLWFALSAGLLGLIVGYGFGRGWFRKSKP